MIQNPHITAYRYDPYSKEMTSEAYDINTMKQVRLESINKARNSKVFGLILGTLGRQGNVLIFNRIQKLISDKGCMVIPFLMAEINPTKLSQIDEIEVI
jgi:2-(3-amino-3-carboxypropyl)histidine synthase